ncbi:hypothetical protein EV702DRAFT_1194673 [Suillus placidus]|uniref:Uncharacterized protein n=1 Tax=Suillus placidus TaxID=48579 RepID=A0A9P7A024_9AGAM|nr:hypothetical protein EV702DRAFT_1194673 [Suillus placidus]
MEVLQMVKFSLKKERLNFTKGWAAPQWAMETVMVSDNGSNELLAPVSSRPTDDSHAYEAVLRAIAEHECDDIDDEAIWIFFSPLLDVVELELTAAAGLCRTGIFRPWLQSPIISSHLDVLETLEELEEEDSEAVQEAAQALHDVLRVSVD